MQPTRYLNLGTGLVFLIVGAIITMGWIASNRVGGQHAAYLAQQQQLRLFEQLRASTNRIVSSTNEFALIALTSTPGNYAAETSPAEPPDEDGGSRAAMQRERQLIETAVTEFHNAYSALYLDNQQAQSGTPRCQGAWQDV